MVAVYDTDEDRTALIVVLFLLFALIFLILCKIFRLPATEGTVGIKLYLLTRNGIKTAAASSSHLWRQIFQSGTSRNGARSSSAKSSGRDDGMDNNNDYGKLCDGFVENSWLNKLASSGGRRSQRKSKSKNRGKFLERRGEWIAVSQDDPSECRDDSKLLMNGEFAALNLEPVDCEFDDDDDILFVTNHLRPPTAFQDKQLDSNDNNCYSNYDDNGGADEFADDAMIELIMRQSAHPAKSSYPSHVFRSNALTTAQTVIVMEDKSADLLPFKEVIV